MKRSCIATLAVITLPALVATVTIADEPGRGNAEPRGTDARVGMMHGAGMSAAGTAAMRAFMQSERAPRAMADMMEMARRMGNGDVMLGMTRMMEMMGSMDGMLGGRGGMMRPGARRPGN